MIIITTKRRLEFALQQLWAKIKATFALINHTHTSAEISDLQTECSQKEIEQIFDGLMWEDDSMWLPSMDIDQRGNVALNIDVDGYGNATFADN